MSARSFQVGAHVILAPEPFVGFRPVVAGPHDGHPALDLHPLPCGRLDGRDGIQPPQRVGPRVQQSGRVPGRQKLSDLPVGFAPGAVRDDFRQHEGEQFQQASAARQALAHPFEHQQLAGSQQDGSKFGIAIVASLEGLEQAREFLDLVDDHVPVTRQPILRRQIRQEWPSHRVVQIEVGPIGASLAHQGRLSHLPSARNDRKPPPGARSESAQFVRGVSLDHGVKFKLLF